MCLRALSGLKICELTDRHRATHFNGTFMAGCYRNPAANTKAFAGGWLHNGDIGEIHADSYAKLNQGLVPPFADSMTSPETHLS